MSFVLKDVLLSIEIGEQEMCGSTNAPCIELAPSWQLYPSRLHLDWQNQYPQT